MTDRDLDVVTLGECLIALVAAGNMPLAEAHTFHRYVAGAEANAAVGLARLGCRVAYIGRVGDDALGRAAVTALRGAGVDVDHLKVDPGWTGVLLREVRGAGPSEVWYMRRGSAGSALSTADVDDAAGLFARAHWLHLTGITPALSATCREAWTHALHAAVAAGCRVSLDVNLRTKLWDPAEAADVVLPAAAHCDVVLAGADEAQLLTGAADGDAAAASMLDAGAKAVVLKLGADGACWYGGDGERVTRPALRVPSVVDAVGAGDAFAAGYLSAERRGLDPAGRLEVGNVCGAFAVATEGDQAGLPTAAQVERALGGGPDVTR